MRPGSRNTRRSEAVRGDRATLFYWRPPKSSTALAGVRILSEDADGTAGAGHGAAGPTPRAGGRAPELARGSAALAPNAAAFVPGTREFDPEAGALGASVRAIDARTPVTMAWAGVGPALAGGAGACDA